MNCALPLSDKALQLLEGEVESEDDPGPGPGLGMNVVRFVV